MTRLARELLEPRRLSRYLGSRKHTVISRIVAPRRAAVAAILRDLQGSPEILMMKRVQRNRDRWSGHVSFPGGMAEERDADLRATAVRETSEEVAIDLDAHARLIGRMDDQVAISHGGPLPLAITPFVFELQDDVKPVPGPEAEDVFWLPLDEVLSGRLDAVFAYRFGALRKDLPSWKWQDFTVWGLTWRMTTTLLELAEQAGD